MPLHKSEAEILSMLASCEQDIKEISSTSSDTMGQLSNMPVCSEKALKSLGKKYMTNIKSVQKTLHELSYLLDMKSTNSAKGKEKGMVATKRQQILLRLEQLEAQAAIE